MREGLEAVPSPTPHGGPFRSLIPSSPSRVSLHRNRLDRGSSSAGHVTAAGLTTWKRQPRRNSSDDESEKKGMGMGMEGTPGRRKKPRKTSKVRNQLVNSCYQLIHGRVLATTQHREDRARGARSILTPHHHPHSRSPTFPMSTTIPPTPSPWSATTPIYPLLQPKLSERIRIWRQMSSVSPPSSPDLLPPGHWLTIRWKRRRSPSFPSYKIWLFR